MLISVFDSAVPEIPEYEGCSLDATFLGGKGFGLWRMQKMGVNVPPALIIPTAMCVAYMANPKTVMKRVAAQYSAIEKFFKGHFGYMPLLSIRSGARVSMPGMMDTILNVGLDSNTQEEWVSRIGPEACADSTYRLITMYGNVVHGIPRHELEQGDAASALRVFEKATGEEFPSAKEQVLGAVEAVFKSWNNDRAKFYRKMHNIPEEWGTAVVIQAMVFGNMNDNSCTGVLFTRNPDTGDNEVVGEYLVNAQGEDVVAGIRTPENLNTMPTWSAAVADELLAVVTTLEKNLRDVQDVEFTVQDGKLYILQTRNAKRGARAAVKIAVEMAEEGLILPEEALKRVSMRELDLAQQSILDPTFKEPEFATGISACSGVVTGKPVFSSADAINCKEPCILITQETTPDDIAGMDAAVGVITMTGGATSHAAVVARGMNKPCIVGVGGKLEDYQDTPVVSFDGSTGKIWKMSVDVVDGSKNEYVAKLKAYAMKVASSNYTATLLGSGNGTAFVCMGNQYYLPLQELVSQLIQASKEHETVWVDLMKPVSKAEELYQRMFLPPEAKGAHEEFTSILLNAFAAQGGAGNVTFFVDEAVASPEGVEVVRAATTLESLILGEKCILWVGPPSKAVKKVLSWQKNNGASFLRVGQLDGNFQCFLSEKQILASLLRE